MSTQEEQGGRQEENDQLENRVAIYGVEIAVDLRDDIEVNDVSSKNRMTDSSDVVIGSASPCGRIRISIPSSRSAST